jgi:hypothetical protein
MPHSTVFLPVSSSRHLPSLDLADRLHACGMDRAVIFLITFDMNFQSQPKHQ